MGEEENVEIARRLFDRWAEGDFWSAELLDPDIRFQTFMPDSTEEVATRGLAGLADYMREFFEQWQGYKIVGEEFEEVGEEKVFVSGRQSATGRQSGAEVVAPIYAVLALEEGRVIELLIHYDRAKALEALGLER
jgi:ketosteroid isomerase-like protein